MRRAPAPSLASSRRPRPFAAPISSWVLPVWALTAAGCSTCRADPVEPTDSGRSVVAAPVIPAAPASATFRATDAVVATREALAAHRHDDAITTATRRLEALTASPHPDEAGELRWLLAEALTAAERVEDAERTLGLLAASGHRLAPWAAVRLAEQRYEASPAEALALVEQRATETWPGRDDAAWIAARATTSIDPARGEVLLRALVGSSTRRIADRATEALATLLATRASSGERAEAVRLLRALGGRVPPARARELDARAAELVPALAPEDRTGLEVLSFTERYARAEHLESAMQLRQAADAFAALANDAPRGEALRCGARSHAAQDFQRARAHTEASSAYAAVRAECRDDGDQLANALYFDARSQLRSGHAERAHALYLELEQTLPQHRLTDDALVLAAKIDLGRGAHEAAHTLLERAATLDGDMRGEALFLLGWDHRRSGARPEALAAFERAERANPSSNDDLIGRAAYWRARTLAESGRTDDAIAAYRAIVSASPLRFYGQLAAIRLRDDHHVETPAVTIDPAGLTPAPTALHEEPHFAMAVSLLHVGALDLADRELEAGGHLRGDLGDLASVAVLYEQNGVPHRACELARRRLASGLDRALELPWLLRAAYPKAFEGLVESSATEADVPASFVRAIAREESSWNPRALSPVHAHGLLQLMRGTAERLARPLDVSVRGDALFTPAVNLRLGARYLGQLERRFDGVIPLVPAAYNAGEGAVERWVEERGTLAVDEWLEEIPYPETRNYTRRVLQTWGIYSLLDEGALPDIDVGHTVGAH